jgi:hypothetical protein
MKFFSQNGALKCLRQICEKCQRRRHEEALQTPMDTGHDTRAYIQYEVILLKIPNEEIIDSLHCNAYELDIRELKDRYCE